MVFHFFNLKNKSRDYLDYLNEAIVCREAHQENLQLKIIVKKDGWGVGRVWKRDATTSRLCFRVTLALR